MTVLASTSSFETVDTDLRNQTWKKIKIDYKPIESIAHLVTKLAHNDQNSPKFEYVIHAEHSLILKNMYIKYIVAQLAFRVYNSITFLTN